MNILSEILSEKRREVAGKRKTVPLSFLFSKAADAATPRGFLKTLRQRADPVSLIAEVKKASPSKGVIVQDFDPVRIASQYEQGGASCLSVLTEEKFFQGSLDDLRLVVKQVSLPVLRKDFILDEYQLFESRASGADCVLLIVAALDKSQLRDLLAVVSELGMDALVEVHNEGEMSVAVDAGAKLIGINNRDLTTFETDLDATARLAPLAPEDAFLVSESAIRNRNDVAKVVAAGARAVLVGESLICSENISGAVRELLGR